MSYKRQSQNKIKASKSQHSATELLLYLPTLCQRIQLNNNTEILRGQAGQLPSVLLTVSCMSHEAKCQQMGPVVYRICLRWDCLYGRLTDNPLQNLRKAFGLQPFVTLPCRFCMAERALLNHNFNFRESLVTFATVSHLRSGRMCR